MKKFWKMLRSTRNSDKIVLELTDVQIIHIKSLLNFQNVQFSLINLNKIGTKLPRTKLHKRILKAPKLRCYTKQSTSTPKASGDPSWAWHIGYAVLSCLWPKSPTCPAGLQCHYSIQLSIRRYRNSNKPEAYFARQHDRYGAGSQNSKVTNSASVNMTGLEQKWSTCSHYRLEDYNNLPGTRRSSSPNNHNSDKFTRQATGVWITVDNILDVRHGVGLFTRRLRAWEKAREGLAYFSTHMTW